MALSSLAALVHETIVARQVPVVTTYDIFKIVWDLYTTNDSRVRKRTLTPAGLQFSKVVSQLSGERFIRTDPEFAPSPAISTVYRVSENPDRPAEDVGCLVDPFLVVGYLSAMQRYSLTVRQPVSIMMSRPPSHIWHTLAEERYIEDFGVDPRTLAFFRPLIRREFPTIVRNRPFEVHNSKRIFRSQIIDGSFARIISLGDLFVQMLSTPELCGGMDHILEVWEENAEIYLDDIIFAINNDESPINKVRAGYILQEKMGIDDSRIDAWKAFAQRGGSRKLDPSKPYGPTFSPTWMIGINV